MPASEFPELAMTRFALALGLVLLLGACGGNPSVIDGTWTAVLSGAQQIYTPTAITLTLTSTGNNGLSVTNLPASALGYCNTTRRHSAAAERKAQ